MDNTLYLVCVVTRGSSWRSAIVDETIRIHGVGQNEEDTNYQDTEYDIEALESLGLIRTERNAPDMVEALLGQDEGTSSLFLFPEWMTGVPSTNYSILDDPLLQSFPSTNDTELLILKPMVVNLDSKSSKCTEIKTPVDPTKLRFIDNKVISHFLKVDKFKLVDAYSA